MMHRADKLVRLRRTLLLFCIPLLSAPGLSAQAKPSEGLGPIRSYISNGWNVLTRSMTQCDSVKDPKLAAPAVLYLPAGFSIPPAVEKLQADCKVEVKHLPQEIHRPGEIDVSKISPHGLLYLEKSYVVPGGRFNEMYGWDSYFTLLGLLRDGRLDLARNIVDNFLFEIQYYGTVLNANRTYYLTRSQPPFLTSMVWDVYRAQKAAGHEDRAWLERAYESASHDYEMWVREPHLAGDTGLSRYYDFGDGPVAEGLQDETGYYRTVATFFYTHPELAAGELIETRPDQANPEAVGFSFSLQVCESTTDGQKCDPFRTLSLTRDFYKGDRSMRESGFDVSFRFGPHGDRTHHFAPVCLNSLLYKTETDLEQMSQFLGKKEDAAKWRQRAEDRKQRMNKYLWDEQKGLFFDYDVDKQQRSTYEYITTFYPLWAGLATPDQARALLKNLSSFEQAGGLAMSRTEPGTQWDYPYAWAPTQIIAVTGLRRYGFKSDADRIAYKFLSMIAENFRRDGTIREKYNAVTRSSETHVTAGYHANVVGFGWTNGAFLEILHDLPPSDVERLAKEQNAPAAEAK